MENVSGRHVALSPPCCHATYALVGKTVTQQASHQLVSPTLPELGMANGAGGMRSWDH